MRKLTDELKNAEEALAPGTHRVKDRASYLCEDGKTRMGWIWAAVSPKGRKRSGLARSRWSADTIATHYSENEV